MLVLLTKACDTQTQHHLFIILNVWSKLSGSINLSSGYERLNIWILCYTEFSESYALVQLRTRCYKSIFKLLVHHSMSMIIRGATFPKNLAHVLVQNVFYYISGLWKKLKYIKCWRIRSSDCYSSFHILNLFHTSLNFNETNEKNDRFPGFSTIFWWISMFENWKSSKVSKSTNII